MPKINFITKEFFEGAVYSTQRNLLRSSMTERDTAENIKTGERPRTAAVRSKNSTKKSFQLNFKKETQDMLKARLAKEDPILDPYVSPHEFTFRNLQPPFNRKDFCLRFKCPPPYNHLGISDHDRRPKEAIERERKLQEAEAQKKQAEYTTMLTGKFQAQKAWQQYVKLPDRKRQVGTSEYHPLFKREEYVEPVILLARQCRDDVNFGKPLFRLYSRALKPSDVNYELGGVKKPFKVLY
eukprot:TRINITY_DN1469_c0_g2_i3.p1 TRINITY_DN1469_c0_g2~~TRINITY_DN1469_c0_g2_i3.p1  ORF type:complete len:239 (-),score=73.04 TRINITY_DN1469_c0_g2_i3:55-771(-)